MSPDFYFDDDFDDEDDFDPADDCMLGNDGQCGAAGSEWCDFECPYRDSELFAGSEGAFQAMTPPTTQDAGGARPLWRPDRNEQVAAIEILLASSIPQELRRVLRDLEYDLATRKRYVTE